MPLLDLASAINDFHNARNRAAIKEILSFFKGANTKLLSYDEVRQMLKLKGSAEVGLRDIPLDAIIGSVGRYTDFTRDFLPRSEVSQDRWARVKLAASDLSGLPPIEVYQIGEAYFVKDGNHRVSVARELGATHIQAYVTEIRTRVPLTPDIRPDELILKAEYADFLEKTDLDDLRPQANLEVSVPGQYQILEEHIDVHRYFMGLDQKRDISYEEAVTHWYDTVYLPVVQIIQEQGILQLFPNRTETDLYLWIGEHRAALEKELGWQIHTEEAASDLADNFSSRPSRLVARLGEKILGAITIESFESGPPTGQWRRKRVDPRRNDCLFEDILVPVNGREEGWEGLTQAIAFAQLENARLLGLHVVPTDAQAQSEAALGVQAEFNRRCADAGVRGELVLAVGEVGSQVCTRARWADLIVTRLAYPPAPQPLARLSSGFHTLIQRCPTPILAVPQASLPIRKALLAYDGSPKAQEALFVATYIAGKWQVPLGVVNVQDNGKTNAPALDEAKDYLDAHGIEAAYIQEHGPSAERILSVARAEDSNLIIMGGYGGAPVIEVVLGSGVDQVLREFGQPVLICR